MRIAALLFLMVFLPASAVSAVAQGAGVSGRWQGTLYGSSVVAEMEQDGQMLSGVVTVTGMGGQKDIYHVAGAVFDHKIYVLHGTGHVFEGEVENDRVISGVLTTAGGKRIVLHAERLAVPPAATPGASTVPEKAPENAPGPPPNG